MSDDEGWAAELHGGPDPATGGGLVGPPASMETMRQSFLDFFDAEYHLVVRFMMRNGASLDEAQDAAQEAFKRGWLAVMHRQWPQITHPRAWIRAVAFNHHRAQLRRPVPTGQTPESTEPGPGHAELTDQALDIVAALKLIGDEHARAVIALDMDDIPGPTIAAALGLTQQRVRDLRKKARRTLERHLLPPTRRSAETTRSTDNEDVEGRQGR